MDTAPPRLLLQSDWRGPVEHGSPAFCGSVTTVLGPLSTPSSSWSSSQTSSGIGIRCGEVRSGLPTEVDGPGEPTWSPSGGRLRSLPRPSSTDPAAGDASGAGMRPTTSSPAAPATCGVESGPSLLQLGTLSSTFPSPDKGDPSAPILGAPSWSAPLPPDGPKPGPGPSASLDLSANLRSTLARCASKCTRPFSSASMAASIRALQASVWGRTSPPPSCRNLHPPQSGV